MGQGKMRRVACCLSKGNQVQVQWARFVRDLFRAAARFFFESLEFLEQRFRRFTDLRLKAHDGVYE